MTRMTASRGGRHPGNDRLDIAAGVLASVLAVALGLGLYHLAAPLTDVNPFFAFGAMVLTLWSAFMIASRGVVLLSRAVRPWLFDREQRHHEIVPACPERTRSRA